MLNFIVKLRKKYTEDDYKNKCAELDLIYIGTHKEGKLGTMIEFICKKHKDKGIQSKDAEYFNAIDEEMINLEKYAKQKQQSIYVQDVEPENAVLGDVWISD